MQATINEAYGQIDIVANKIGKFTLKVFDNNGLIAKKLCTDIMEGFQKFDLNLSEWAAGTYIINAFNGENFLKSFKLIRQ